MTGVPKSDSDKKWVTCKVTNKVLKNVLSINKCTIATS